MMTATTITTTPWFLFSFIRFPLWGRARSLCLLLSHIIVVAVIMITRISIGVCVCRLSTIDFSYPIELIGVRLNLSIYSLHVCIYISVCT